MFFEKSKICFLSGVIQIVESEKAKTDNNWEISREQISL
jgi:hypothetical protein